MNVFRKITILIIGLLTLSLTIPAWSASNLVVSEGEEAYEEALIGLRLRSFNNTGGSELFLGVPDLALGTNRNEANIQWAETNGVSFSLNRLTDSLNVTIVNGNGTYSLDYPNVSSQLAALGKTYTVDDLNIMQITLVDRDEGEVLLQNAMIDGQTLGDFSGDNWNHWMVSGYDFSQGFELTGTLLLTGSFSNSQEMSKIEFRVGHQFVPDTTPPTTTIDNADSTTEVIGPQLGTAVFEFSGTDETTANENLRYECRLNDGDWTPCTSPVTYTDLAPGSYTFTARAIDEAGNADANPPSQQWTISVSYIVYIPVVIK
ncbi:MAG: hypothetical protein CL608_29835 [Anaerolineaceae bacterium]|nr:hypothetical protein [Anaerolineaceae bacterium]